MRRSAPAIVRCAIWVFALVGACAPGFAADLHGEAHARFARGPKMDITVATFFGVSGPEEFVAVAEAADGGVLAGGNAWGPPFVSNVEARVLGGDEPWPVPLYPAGMVKDRKGDLLPPSERNPNRTGFVALYSEDLRQLKRVVRFGWGVASLSAVLPCADGGAILAGTATARFRDLTKPPAVSRIEPAGSGAGFGSVEYEGNVQPGDVYVAKLAPGLDALVWVWVLEGHRTPPRALFTAPDGSLVFLCHGVRRIAPDGGELREIVSGGAAVGSRLLGVRPGDGLLLVGRTLTHETRPGIADFRRPAVDLLTPAGKPFARYYDWPASLAGQEAFGLTADSEVVAGGFTPSGEIVAVIASRGLNSVATRSPVDLEATPKPGGVGLPKAAVRPPSPGGAPVLPPLVAHVAKFSPDAPTNVVYATWAGLTQTMMGDARVAFAGVAPNGRLMLAGDADAFLVQTTTRWFRDTEHYLWSPDFKVEGGGIEITPQGWPAYLGTGGRGGFSAVLSADAGTVLWSSAIAFGEHTAMAATRRGIVAVSRCTGGVMKDARTPLFVNHDIVRWTEFVLRLRDQAGDDRPSPGKRTWAFLSAGLKTFILPLKAGDEVPVTLKKRFLFELNKILLDFPNYYDAASWEGRPFDDYERDLIAQLGAATIAKRDVADLNRRLLEKGFPEFVFASPKANRTPVLNAVQATFGGGYSDGHIYLLEDVKP